MRGRRPARALAAGLLLGVLLVAAPAARGEERAGGTDPYAALGLTLPRERLPAPAFTLDALAGGQGSLAGQAGHLVLINFWATWCTPCVKELPALEHLWRDYGPQGLTVLAVNVDRGRRGHVAGYARRLGLTLPVLLDADGDVRRDYEVRALPTTYLIGRDGRIVGRTLGEQDWDDAAHRAALQALLSASTPSPIEGTQP